MASIVDAFAARATDIATRIGDVDEKEIYRLDVVMAQTYSMAEVARHASKEDLWMVIGDGVYDLTKFAAFHPGGASFIVAAAGQDASEAFYALHRAEILEKTAKKYRIGTLEGATARAGGHAGALSAVPYAEPSAFQGAPSPYYDESHVRFRHAVRAFYDEHVRPDMVQKDIAGQPPSAELYEKLGAAGMLSLIHI